MKKIILLLILSCIVFPAFSAEEGKDWLKAPNVKDIYSKEYPEINPKYIYEVVSTKEATALHRLANTSIKKIDEGLAKWYTGHYYQCENGKQAYLVRAVYGHGGTGKYELKRIRENLLIIHDSLGKQSVYNKSALVVNLDFEPKDLFIVVGIDE